MDELKFVTFSLVLILMFMFVLIESESHSVVSDTLRLHPWREHGVLQARILEGVAIPFSRGSSQSRDQTQVSRIGRFFTVEPPGKPRRCLVSAY